MALGYGFTNEVMLATSPWLMAFYNLQNWALRYRSPSLDPTWGLQAAYFQSDPKLGKTYEMRATGAWLLWRKRFTSSYRLVLSLNNFYFFDDTRPFSLRRWSLGSRTDEKSQWTFSTLHEMGTGGPIRLFVEAGILGFTYSNPNYHFGASGAYRWKGGYIQFGLSATGYLSNINKSAYNQVYNELNGTGATISFESVYRNSVAVHPEVQVQFLF
jgi:hypothetical protein